ncbi:MAG: hypothetical protein JWO41_405 [Candidatus Saccharibacteria bacterium]|nr:hypothetical protein [Candidatus Saccharibacteria bacterium]
MDARAHLASLGDDDALIELVLKYADTRLTDVQALVSVSELPGLPPGVENAFTMGALIDAPSENDGSDVGLLELLFRDSQLGSTRAYGLDVVGGISYQHGVGTAMRLHLRDERRVAVDITKDISQPDHYIRSQYGDSLGKMEPAAMIRLLSALADEPKIGQLINSQPEATKINYERAYELLLDLLAERSIITTRRARLAAKIGESTLRNPYNEYASLVFTENRSDDALERNFTLIHLLTKNDQDDDSDDTITRYSADFVSTGDGFSTASLLMPTSEKLQKLTTWTGKFDPEDSDLESKIQQETPETIEIGNDEALALHDIIQAVVETASNNKELDAAEASYWKIRERRRPRRPTEEPL